MSASESSVISWASCSSSVPAAEKAIEPITRLADQGSEIDSDSPQPSHSPSLASNTSAYEPQPPPPAAAGATAAAHGGPNGSANSIFTVTGGTSCLQQVDLLKGRQNMYSLAVKSLSVAATTASPRMVILTLSTFVIQVVLVALLLAAAKSGSTNTTAAADGLQQLQLKLMQLQLCGLMSYVEQLLPTANVDNVSQPVGMSSCSCLLASQGISAGSAANSSNCSASSFWFADQLQQVAHNSSQILAYVLPPELATQLEAASNRATLARDLELAALIMLVVIVVGFYVTREVVDALSLAYIVAATIGIVPVQWIRPEHRNGEVRTLLRHPEFGWRKYIAYSIQLFQIVMTVLAFCTACELLMLPAIFSDRVKLVLNGVALVFVLEVDDKLGDAASMLDLAGNEAANIPYVPIACHTWHDCKGLHVARWVWAWRVYRFAMVLTLAAVGIVGPVYVLRVAHTISAQDEGGKFLETISVLLCCVLQALSLTALLGNHMGVAPYTDDGLLHQAGLEPEHYMDLQRSAYGARSNWFFFLVIGFAMGVVLHQFLISGYTSFTSDVSPGVATYMKVYYTLYYMVVLAVTLFCVLCPPVPVSGLHWKLRRRLLAVREHFQDDLHHAQGLCAKLRILVICVPCYLVPYYMLCMLCYLESLTVALGNWMCGFPALPHADELW